MLDIICVGILVADLVGGPLLQYPDKGKLITVEDMSLHTGGCAANTGIALSRLGIKTGVMGKVGSDGLGDFLINVLKKEAIDTKGIVRSKESNTSSTMVIVDNDGERSFIHHIGANADFGIKDVNFNLLKNCKIAHIAGSFLMPKFDGNQTKECLRKLKKYKIITSVDTAWDHTGRWLETIEQSLPFVDIFIPSIDEAELISGKDTPEEMAEFFMKYGVKTVVIKMGDKGSFAKDKDTEIYMPSFKVEAKDTTGAGDSFVAGFLAGIVRGLSLEKSLKLANAVGAMCVTQFGASAGIKNFDETMKFICNNKTLD